MGTKICWDTLNLRPHSRPGHCEYTLHYDLMSRVTGLPVGHADLERRFREAWQIDMAWLTNDGPVPWAQRGRVTDMGHAEFAADGSDRRDAATCPFATVEEVLAFDAVGEYGLPPMDELVAYYQDFHRRQQAASPDVVLPGGYYRTIISGAIQTFGWDMLLEAAASQTEFEDVLDSFFRLALHHFRAWAETDIRLFICHDDMVWSSGPFMHPDFYRRVLFPRYQQLWQVLREAGKKILYCADGQWTMFLDDIAEAGADGFIFEPMTSFEVAVEKFGRTHVLVGSDVDCRTLTFGSQQQIKAEIDRSLLLGRDCPGWIAAVGNHIAPNVPVENAIFYHDYLSSHWSR